MNETDLDDGIDVVTLAFSYLLLVVAFAFSYTHVVDAVRAWGQPEIAAYGIAAMPEVTVFIGMRKLLAGQGNRFVFFVLATAGAFTLAGNLHSAQHTLGGFIAAGWPAYSAVTALVLSGVHGRRRTRSESTERTRTVAEVRIGRERIATSKTLPESKPPVIREVRTMTPPPAQAKPATRPTVTLVGAEPVTPTREPRALTSTPAPQGQGHEAVTAWLARNWDPATPLDKKTKADVISATGVSEPTVKRAARALKIQYESNRGE